MLLTGFKGGNVLNNLRLNKLIDTAEQVSNINVCSHIKGLSNDNGNNGTNTIYHKQERDRLVLVAVYFSTTSLTTDTYPSLLNVTGMNGVDEASSFLYTSSDTEIFNFVKDDVDYILTVKKTIYSVSIGGLKRLKFTFKPMLPKNWAGEKLNSMYVIQYDSVNTSIERTIEEGLSGITSLNQVKEAFRKRQSYNLTCEGINASYAQDNRFWKNILVQEDLYEFGIPASSTLRFLDTAFTPPRSYQISSTKTTGTTFSYSVADIGDLNFRQFDWFRRSDTSSHHRLETFDGINYSNLSPYYLYTNSTKNLAINSITNDALNSYDLVMLYRDYSKRLQGRLLYPTIGIGVITTESTGAINFLDMIIKNREANADYDRYFTLTSGYKVKFAIT